MTSNILVPSKALLTPGLVSGDSLSVVPQAPYGSSIITSLQDIFLDVSNIEPIPNSSTAYTAETWKISTNLLRTVLNMLSKATYGEESQVAIVVSLIETKLRDAGNNVESINFTRLESSQLGAAYSWLLDQAYKTDQDVTITNALSKESITDIQSVPNNQSLENNLEIYDNNASIQTFLAVELGLDTEFSEKFSPIIELVPTIDVTEAITDAVATAPLNVGSEGAGTAPIMFDGMTALQDSESRNAATQAADAAFWNSASDEIAEFTTPSLYNVPLKEQVDIMAEICKEDNFVEDVDVYVTTSETSGGTGTPTLLRVRKVIEVTRAEVISTIGDSSLSEMDFSVGATVSTALRTILAKADEVKTTNPELQKIKAILPTDSERVRLTWKQLLTLQSIPDVKSTIENAVTFYSLRRQTKTYSLNRAFSLGKVMGKIWDCVKKTKLSDVQFLTNTVATGLAAAGSLTGAQGLTNASNILNTFNDGLATIQAVGAATAEKLASSRITPDQAIQNTMVGTMFNGLPSAFKIGKNIIQTRRSGSSASVLDITDRMTKNARQVKNAVIEANPSTRNTSKTMILKRLTRSS